ncbi:MAG: hypothetical protein AAB922_02960 [Patescibacteria group bacterium]
MNIQEAIEQAYPGVTVEGSLVTIGNVSVSIHEFLLRRETWQCFGIMFGWDFTHYLSGPYQKKSTRYVPNAWKTRWHHFIDHLIQGKSIEDYFKTL